MPPHPVNGRLLGLHTPASPRAKARHAASTPKSLTHSPFSGVITVLPLLIIQSEHARQN